MLKKTLQKSTPTGRIRSKNTFLPKCVFCVCVFLVNQLVIPDGFDQLSQLLLLTFVEKQISLAGQQGPSYINTLDITTCFIYLRLRFAWFPSQFRANFLICHQQKREIGKVPQQK